MSGMPDIAQAIKQLEETATVMAGIQSRQAAMLKDHAEWLQAHDKAIGDARALGRETDERIEKLVIAIGKLVASRSS
jgi:hypothetical protein